MKKNHSGQSLIEVIIGVGVAVMLAISLITTSLVTQRTARSARNNTQATKLAQEYVEEIRGFRDRKGFSSLVDSGCKIIQKTAGSTDPIDWSLQDCPTPPTEKPGEKNPLNSVNFYRSMSIIANPLGSTVEKLITVYIKWDESAGEKIVTSQTVLTKWEGLP